MEPPSSHLVQIANESGRRIPRTLIARAVIATLSLHGKTAPVSLLVTNDSRIQELNGRFRGVDEPTDVLTFPAGDFADGSLGDIAISLDYAERQARLRRVSLSQELGYLAIHGTLHLLGFDDETERDRAEMVRQMNVAAADAGLKPDHAWWSLLHGERRVG